MTQQDSTLPSERRRRRPWVVALPLAIFVLIALAWSGFWFYALSTTETALANWQAREASRGRTFRCGKQSIGGFPFRFELRCVDPSARFDGGAPLGNARRDEHVSTMQLRKQMFCRCCGRGRIDIVENQ